MIRFAISGVGAITERAHIPAFLRTPSASPSGEDGMRAVEIIEASYRASRSGQTIPLPLG